MLNIFGLVMFIATAALLVWSSIRAWEVKNNFFKWGGVSLTALLAAAATFVSVLTIAGLLKLHARSAPVPDLKVAGTTGGMDIGKHFPFPVGSFVSSNLTPAGRVNHYSDGEIFRAIRNGVDADGHWLTVMSYTNAGKLSDDDIQGLIAYIRSQPAAGQETVNPPDQLNLLGVIMLGAGMLPGSKPVFTGVITAPPKGPTVQYGEYILSYQDCRERHGANLAGGMEGQLGPIGPDLNLVKEWKLEEFIATMRTGTDPGGHELSEQMPWRPIGKMDDEELVAVYKYLTHLPGF